MDGWSHDVAPAGRDGRHDAELARRDVRVARVAAADTATNLDGVVTIILADLDG